MSIPDVPFDGGLQPERTLLAWRRTALALAVASAIGLRLTIEDFGPAAVVIGTTGVVLSIGTYIGAAVRYRRAHRSLTEFEALASGAVILAATAGTSMLLAAFALTWLLVPRVGT